MERTIALPAATPLAAALLTCALIARAAVRTPDEAGITAS